MAASRNTWFSLALDTMRLGLEAQTVVNLRLMKFATFGPGAISEAERMISEKMEAAMQVQAQLLTSALSGSAHLAPARTVAHYRRRVRANVRRLAK
ncbi:hypothetical protein [Phenylobacterium sp.]|uniref:hypothetical protein n=1 Tax=Phenylobacterium sp. TaxID=1871053 RepID=UPI0027330E87|nr:hypothetical protein [Phenylobacterium sp.]MDP3660024.1 hypothetical protein [Phenylobacterium sp.]